MSTKSQAQDFATTTRGPATAGPDGPVRGPFILRRGYDQVVHDKRVVAAGVLVTNAPGT